VDHIFRASDFSFELQVDTLTP